MEDYEDYEDYENFDNSEDIKEAAERAREAVLKKAISENYIKLITRGFSEVTVLDWNHNEIEDIMETINYMINYFEEIEEYEKCANLVKARECLINRETFAPIS